jgi:predicted RNA binding protein YcfA (HicA-like mRNA interferase family)
MMPPLPVISGKKAVDTFKKLGWVYARRESSHMILFKPGEKLLLSIPDDKELDRRTLRSQIRDAGLSVDDFLKALRKR